MKKLMILTVIFFMATASASSQNVQNPAALKNSSMNADNSSNREIKKEERKDHRKMVRNEVTYQSRQAFASDFDNVKPTATSTVDGFDKFTFMKKDKEMSAFYDDDAKLVGTVQTKSFVDIPKNAQKTIRDKYSDYTPGAVVFYDDNEADKTNMIMYGIEFEHKDSYFVELKRKSDSHKIVLHVLPDGTVIFFSELQ